MSEPTRAPLLLATHGGLTADGAARLAVQLASRLGAPLEAVSVVEPPMVTDYGYGVVVIPDQDWILSLGESLRALTMEQWERCGVDPRVSYEVLTGSPSWTLAERARQRAASAIIVGLGPHQLVDRAFGGETALHLAQVASTPVLAVPASAKTLPRRVLAAIDFTPSSLRALKLAASWLEPNDELIAAYVAPPKTAVDGAQAGLAQLLAELPATPRLRTELQVLHGEPGPMLLDFAEKRDCDLLALGTHGYGFWKRLALGSVASKLIRVSTRAVLVAPLTGVVAR